MLQRACGITPTHHGEPSSALISAGEDGFFRACQRCSTERDWEWQHSKRKSGEPSFACQLLDFVLLSQVTGASPNKKGSALSEAPREELVVYLKKQAAKIKSIDRTSKGAAQPAPASTLVLFGCATELRAWKEQSKDLLGTIFPDGDTENLVALSQRWQVGSLESVYLRMLSNTVMHCGHAGNARE